MYDIRNGGPYIIKQDNFRKLDDTLKRDIRDAESIQQKYLMNEQLSNIETFFCKT